MPLRSDDPRLMTMDITEAINDYKLVLTEAAVIEALRRYNDVNLHHRLENALLIYDKIGKSTLTGLYNGFISIAHRADVPITLSTPTLRANHERVSEGGIQRDVNGDAVKYLNDLKKKWGTWTIKIGIGGLIGCKNDCYSPNKWFPIKNAKAFHSWQIDRLAEAEVDFLLAATLPAVPEATGIALAMEKTTIPYIISFVINRNGYILDGTSLEKAFVKIDSTCSRPPLGYMINCAYPSFINVESQPEAVLSRLIVYQANASSLDQSDLDCAETLQADDIKDWGEIMVELNRRYDVRILGGCCGTSFEHLQYIIENLNSFQVA